MLGLSSEIACNSEAYPYVLISDWTKENKINIIDPVIEQYKLVTPATEQTPEKVEELKKKLLDQMIDDKLLKQEARKQKIRVSKRDGEEGIDQVKSRFTTESEFQEELKKEDLTMSDFEKRIKEQLMVMKLTEQEIKTKTDMPTEQESEKLFNQILTPLHFKSMLLSFYSGTEFIPISISFLRRWNSAAKKIQEFLDPLNQSV